MLLKFPKPNRLAVPVFALFTLTGFYAATIIGEKPASGNLSKRSEEKIPVYQAKIKYSYDEMAHKLVMEYGSQTREQLNKEISSGLGKALSRVSRQLAYKETVIEL